MIICTVAAVRIMDGRTRRPSCEPAEQRKTSSERAHGNPSPPREKTEPVARHGSRVAARACPTVRSVNGMSRAIRAGSHSVSDVVAAWTVPRWRSLSFVRDDGGGDYPYRNASSLCSQRSIPSPPAQSLFKTE